MEHGRLSVYGIGILYQIICSSRRVHARKYTHCITYPMLATTLCIIIFMFSFQRNILNSVHFEHYDFTKLCLLQITKKVKYRGGKYCRLLAGIGSE